MKKINLENNISKNKNQMEKNNIISEINEIQHNYTKLILNFMEKKEIIGENLLDNRSTHETRLLCQTRVIFYLIKMNEEFNSDTLSNAIELYEKSIQKYKKNKEWSDIILSKSSSGYLYEIAFTIYAESSLYKATNYKKAKDSAYLTKKTLQEIISSNSIKFHIKDIEGNISQRSLMHLFECCILAYKVFEDNDWLIMANYFFNFFYVNFYDTDCNLVKESVTPCGLTLWYELGHSYEWASLISQASYCNREYGNIILVKELISSCEEIAVNCKIPSKLYPNLKEAKAPFRIWPQLERLRALSITNQKDKVSKDVVTILDVFFEQRKPIEYTKKEQKDIVKPTTGYHIINSFQEVKKCLFR